MLRLYSYRLLALLRDKTQVFWVLVFPLLLGTLFYFTFGTTLREESKVLKIDVAAVSENNAEVPSLEDFLDLLNNGEKPQAPPYGQLFVAMLKELSEGNEPLLNVIFTDREEALELLSKEKVYGVYEIENKPVLTVNNNGVEQSILKGILDRYLQTTDMIEKIAQNNPADVKNAIEALKEGSSNVTRLNLGLTEDSMFRENFYALIAMTCLYGSFFALNCTTALMPYMSPLGIRRSVCPVPKAVQVLCDSAASFTLIFCAVIILLLYLIYAFKIDFGNNIAPIVIVAFLGAMCGNFIGIFVGVALKVSHNIKEVILMAIWLALSFLSGLMYPQMRFLVGHSCPVANVINPAALIVDAFYTLDAYGAGQRWFFDVCMLGSICLVLIILSAIVLRKKQYAHV